MTIPSTHDGSRVPRVVWTLGFVSLLMDASSDMIQSVLPLFMLSLGASALLLGLLEGVAESLALVMKLFAGALSDLMRRRKPLVVLGYGLATLAKPLFVFASTTTLVFAARSLDRIGKGIRGAPRDALITDLTPAGVRGAAFGLRQALDTVGALMGPLLALVILTVLAADFATVFIVALVPAVLSLAVLVFFVREPARSTAAPAPRPEWRMVGELPSSFWWVAAIGGGLSLARCSEAFLILRGDSLGLGLGYAPVVLLVMNAVYAAAAFPLGRFSDRLGVRGHAYLLSLAMVLLVAADVVLIRADDALALWLGVALWGLHLAASQGLLSRMVADAAPAHLRGTAFGVFHAIAGLLVLASNVAVGALWDALGPAVAFGAAGTIAALTLTLILVSVATRREQPS